MKERKVIDDQLRVILSDNYGDFINVAIEDSTLLFPGIFTDSLDKLELTIILEDEFSITFPDEEIEKVTTFSQLVDLVHSKL